MSYMKGHGKGRFANCPYNPALPRPVRSPHNVRYGR